MVVLRTIARLFVLLALVFAGLDAFIWLDGRATQQAGRVWFELHLASLNYSEVVVSRHLNLPGFWRDAVVPYLKLPAWEAMLWPVIVLLILGGFLSVIGRRRTRKGRFS